MTTFEDKTPKSKHSEIFFKSTTLKGGRYDKDNPDNKSLNPGKNDVFHFSLLGITPLKNIRPAYINPFQPEP